MKLPSAFPARIREPPAATGITVHFREALLSNRSTYICSTFPLYPSCQGAQSPICGPPAATQQVSMHWVHLQLHLFPFFPYFMLLFYLCKAPRFLFLKNNPKKRGGGEKEKKKEGALVNKNIQNTFPGLPCHQVTARMSLLRSTSAKLLFFFWSF